ncbi:sphingosine 1-phosphate receptor 5b [Triplophysa rosa]|uniref:Sphingosine 1-phosphate receptor 1-like n=1 Tax=Triplophysa rosa TaxID=992332 RepID=A0A9W7WSZ6_TRIRA|nr:sphingosine 1-phosphate receptor 5b [Triplophysa rosa]XP_057193966.1 sphingosine 1-phosphate receptor 5b [Triplophysa rosa]KAI7807706.1 putative sphingosine 1-phosphate receptor 1-like [Triplophysa rosa]
MEAFNASTSSKAASYQSNSVLQLHYNYTGKLDEDRYMDGLKPGNICFLFICLLIVVENCVVLVAIWRNKKFHMPMYYLLGNLTLSDLLAGFTYMLNIVLSGRNTLTLTPLLWFLREGGVFFTLAASVISLLAIAVERYATILNMKTHRRTKCNRILALIVASWALSLLLGVLPVLGWNCLRCLSWCSTVLPLYAKSYIFFCVFMFMTVLLAIVLLYGRIFHFVKSNTQNPARNQHKGFSRRSQKYMVLLKTVTVVVGVFILCWMPLFVLLLLDFVCPVKSCPVLFKADYFLGVAMINSLINPVIYTLTSRDMRRAIVKLLFQRCLMTREGRMRKIAAAFPQCSFTKMEANPRGMETSISSGNATTVHVKPIYPKLRVSVVS